MESKVKNAEAIAEKSVTPRERCAQYVHEEYSM